jgi:hypothetical protein
VQFIFKDRGKLSPPSPLPAATGGATSLVLRFHGTGRAQTARRAMKAPLVSLRSLSARNPRP